jgi:hypothetical protein
MLAPSLGALGAGVRDHAPFRMKIEDLDARLCGIEGPFFFKGTCHLALETTSTLNGFDLK